MQENKDIHNEIIHHHPKPTKKDMQEPPGRDFSNGILIIDFSPSVTEEIVKSALPHAVSVSCDARFGSCHSEFHHSFLVKYEKSKHRPDMEILSLAPEMFIHEKVNYAFVADSFESSLFNLVKRVYGEELFLIGSIRKEVSCQDINKLIPVANCVFEYAEETTALDNEMRKSMIVSTNDIANFFSFARSLLDSMFCGKKRYCAIENTVSEAAEKLVKVIDSIPTKIKTNHKKGKNRFIIANLPTSIDAKALLRMLPHAGEEGASDVFESLALLESGTRHAVVVSYVSLLDEIELQELCDKVFDGMKPKYTLIKTTPSAAVKALRRHENNVCGNWLQIKLTDEEASKSDEEKEKLILSKTPEIVPQMIVYEEKSVWVDYITKENCEKAVSLIK